MISWMSMVVLRAGWALGIGSGVGSGFRSVMARMSINASWRRGSSSIAGYFRVAIVRKQEDGVYLRAERCAALAAPCVAPSRPGELASTV
jgi:hypothetical protein